MRKLKSSPAVKAIAVLLFLCFVLAAFVCVLGISANFGWGTYDGHSREAVTSEAVRVWGYNNVYGVINAYHQGIYLETKDVATGFTFALFDERGEVLYDGLDGREILWESNPIEFTYSPEDNPEEISHSVIVAGEDGLIYSITGDVLIREGMDSSEVETDTAPAATPELAESPVPTEEVKPNASPEPSESPVPAENNEAKQPQEQKAAQGPVTCNIVGYVLADLPAGSYPGMMVRISGACYDMKDAFVCILMVSAVLGIALFIFLMAAAGHKKNSEGVKPGFVEKIPFDIYTIGVGIAGGILLAIFNEFSYGNISVLKLVSFGIIIALGAALCLWWCMSFAVRLKTHNVIKSCVCYRIIAWCWRNVKKLWRFCADVFRGMRLMPKATLVIGGILLVEFFWICVCDGNGEILFGWFVERLVLVALTLYTLLCMKKLLQAGKEISGGNMDYRVDTGRMRGPLKEHGEQLNRITEGMNKAVNERMKSEHFRTELITNVSHDIKTPLTSIINYVDLLEKEDFENKKAREYLEVLSRQSARLKKLIDDLMEASKASTGNVAVNWERCELGVLIDQCTGEYGEKLKAANLELVVTKPEEPVIIRADGRHMWRVFDNLLSNICKYAMPGTRVYLNLDQAPGKATVTFRNISANQLNISGDELMERFVRGDASRNTEGSGLGLSIARSLVQLQKGQMDLIVDGDLFKVTVSFHVAE